MIELDPNFDWAYHVRGWIYYRRMTTTSPRKLRDRHQAGSHRDRLHRDRGNVSYIRKKYDDAIKDYTKSIEMEPKYIVPWQMRGKSWEAKKEYAKALADYEKAAELATKQPYDAGYHTQVAIILPRPDAKVRDGKKA